MPSLLAIQPSVVHEQLQRLVAARGARAGIQQATDGGLAPSLLASLQHQQHPPGAALPARGSMEPTAALEQLPHTSLQPPGLAGYEGLGVGAGQVQEAGNWQGGPPAAPLAVVADGAFSSRSGLPPHMQQQRWRAQLAQELPAGAAPLPGPLVPWPSLHHNA